MTNKLTDIVNKFKDRKILVIGDLMLDEYIYGTVTRVSPEAPVNIVKKEFVYHFPGGAANTANNVKALGAEAILVGVIGEDINKGRLCKVMGDLGISTEYLLVDKSRPTTTKTRIVANNKQVVRVDTESTNNINEELEKKALDAIKELIKSADAVVLSDYAKGSLTQRICEEVIRACRELGKKIIVDPKVEFSKYKGATIITPNEKEFRIYSGITGEYESSDALNVIKKNELDALLITKGKDGMTIYEKDKKTVDVSALNHGYDVVDITGAGDTVISAFTLALSSGASMEEAMFIANVAAGIVVKKQGTATTNTEELKRELERVKNDVIK